MTFSLEIQCHANILLLCWTYRLKYHMTNIMCEVIAALIKLLLLLNQHLLCYRHPSQVLLKENLYVKQMIGLINPVWLLSQSVLNLLPCGNDSALPSRFRRHASEFEL